MRTTPRRSHLFLVRWSTHIPGRGWIARSRLFRMQQYALNFAAKIGDREDVYIFDGGFIDWKPLRPPEQTDREREMEHQ